MVILIRHAEKPLHPVGIHRAAMTAAAADPATTT